MTNRVRACHRTTQDVFRRVRVTACSRIQPRCLRSQVLNSLAPSAPVRLHSAVDRVSDTTTSFELASRCFRSSCLATSRARDARCVRPTSASHHSTTSTRVSWVPDLVTGFPVLSGEVAFHDVASASAGPSLYPTAGDSLSVSPPTKDRSL